LNAKIHQFQNQKFLWSNRMCKGTTLLETLIGVAISSLVISIAGVSLLRIQAQYQSESIRHKEVAGLSVFRGYIQRISDNIGSLRHDISPILHHNGIVKLADGTPHSIMNLGINSRPKSGQDAITSLAVSFPHSLEVRSSRYDAGNLSFDVCPRFKTNRKIDRPKSFIALSLEGAYQVIPSIESKVYFERCSSLNIFNTQSLFFNTAPSADLKNTSLLIPIVSEFTIYLDRSSQLRYVSHTGLRILENQPIIRDLEELGFSLKHISEHSSVFINLRGEIKFVGKSKKIFEITNPIARLDRYQTLYARER